MKTLVLTIALCSLGLMTARAEKIKESAVPEKVKSAFKARYPNVKKAKWEKEGDNYEAEFKLAKTETSVLLDANGILMQTESEILISLLPQPVAAYIQKNVSGKKIKEAAKITESSGKIIYEAEAGGKDYLFDEQGNFLKVEAE